MAGVEVSRESAKLQIAEPMPHMSDGELYLRVNVPDGLENDGSYAKHYGIVQQAHRDPSRTPIKSDSGE
jgi:hypothetical protein